MDILCHTRDSLPWRRKLKETSGRVIESVSTDLAWAVTSYLAGRGIDARTVAARVGLPREAETQGYVDVATYLALLDALTIEVNDEAAVLHYAAHVSMAQVSLLGVIMEGASTMGEALTELRRYSNLAYTSDHPGDTITFTHHAGGSWVRMSDLGGHRYLAEESVTRLVVGPRRFLPRPHVRAAHFVHAAPRYWREYTEILGCPVEFDAPHTAIQVPDDLGSWPVAQLPPQVTQLLRDHAEFQLDSTGGAMTLPARISSMIRASLPVRVPTADDVADALHCSRSTLARALAAEGTTYSAIVWQTRRAIAHDLLIGTDLSVARIGAQVGYSEPTAFIRAFRSRLGVTPADYRTRRGLTTKR